jgi:hypothetical protein
MSKGALPPKPDFDKLLASAPTSADRRTFILALIGNIIFSWSNNESLFIYVLMLLLETDEASAAITFSTLNTTRARLDLILRLAKIKIRDSALERALADLIDRFNETTHLRNELNHCLYVVDESGQITHTQAMRIIQTRDGIRSGELKPMDDDRLRQMMKTTEEMTRINRDIWELLQRLQSHLQAPSRRRVD